MKMPPVTRLFIGGLDKSVSQDVLQSHISNYGSIASIDFKEKNDFDGNVIQRFAYVNIEADHHQIQECKYYLLYLVNFMFLI